MKIRKATKKDIPRMFEILKTNNVKYSKKLALRELNEMFSKSLLKPTYMVVEDKKEILAFGGFVLSWTDNMIADMFWINVDSKRQGKGIGNTLIRGLIKEIKKIKKPKMKMILISTKVHNFYEKFGFKKIGSKYDKDYVLMSMEMK